MNKISFSVSGYPPAKSEAKSMLSAGHQHAARVRLLLEAAEQALREHAFAPVEAEQIALDLVVHAAPGQPPWDATNYLGGVADVLEDKSRRGPLSHTSAILPLCGCIATIARSRPSLTAR